MGGQRPNRRYSRRIADGDQVEVLHDAENGVTITVVRPYHHPFAINWRWVLRGTVIITLILLSLPCVFYLGGVIREMVNSRADLAPLRPAMAYVEGILLLLFGVAAFVSPLLHWKEFVHIIWDLLQRSIRTIRDRHDRSRSGSTLQDALDEAYLEVGVQGDDGD